MVVRLGQLCDVPGVQLVGVQSREILERHVTWVHSIELGDPSRYLNGGELVLTAGIWRRGAAEDAKFIDALAGENAAAVGYGLTEAQPEVPDNIVARCRKHRLPVLGIAPDTPFIAVSRRFVELLSAEQQASLRAALKRGEQMASAIREDRGVKGILDSLELDGKTWAAVVARDGRIMGSTSATVDVAELARLAKQLCRAGSFPAPCRVAGDPAQAFEIHAMRRADAFLIWRSEPGGELDEASHDLVTRTLPYLGLEIARLGAMREMELRFASELVDLMEAQPPRLSELAHRLESLGVSPHRPLAVLALRVEVAGTRSAKERALYDVSRDLGAASIAVSRDQEEFLIIEAPDFDRVAELGENLLSGLSRQSSIRKATLGLGNVASSVDRLRTSLLQARQACALAESGRRNFAVATFRDIATHRLVIAVSDKHVTDSLVQNLLSPIRNYDRERGAALEETLTTFLEHNGNWKAAADHLHVHVNTLRYRIERIAALTGRDLSSMADRVDFYLAIHASDARGNSESAER